MSDSSPDIHVRPFGYVDPEPVIRRVGDRDLWVGNVHAADGERHDCRFDYVVSATREPQPLTTHHCPLVDGTDADWSQFARGVDTTRELYRREGSLLVHCTAGVSRSAALAATVLAAEADRPLRTALDAVQRTRPVAMPHPTLHRLAVEYLAARR
ncbi:dual specificity protein phosphatase family protein [Halorarius litoreus]|uniref:dual specificity protein phosphatase family protein n=1 Tax=Halorarius litoreus TaxID=2962676 RepID=UPI0020CC749D|nr:dual specificity protein phosphatase family protein [Halorarius litoreus]